MSALWWNDNLSRSGCCHQIEIATTDTDNAYVCHYLTYISKSIRKCCIFVFKEALANFKLNKETIFIVMSM